MRYNKIQLNAIKYNKINRKNMGNNPMVGASVAVAVAIEEALNK